MGRDRHWSHGCCTRRRICRTRRSPPLNTLPMGYGAQRLLLERFPRSALLGELSSQQLAPKCTNRTQRNCSAKPLLPSMKAAIKPSVFITCTTAWTAFAKTSCAWQTTHPCQRLSHMPLATAKFDNAATGIACYRGQKSLNGMRATNGTIIARLRIHWSFTDIVRPTLRTMTFSRRILSIMVTRIRMSRKGLARKM